MPQRLASGWYATDCAVFCSTPPPRASWSRRSSLGCTKRTGVSSQFETTAHKPRYARRSARRRGWKIQIDEPRSVHRAILDVHDGCVHQELQTGPVSRIPGVSLYEKTAHRLLAPGECPSAGPRSVNDRSIPRLCIVESPFLRLRIDILDALLPSAGSPSLCRGRLDDHIVSLGGPAYSLRASSLVDVAEAVQQRSCS